METKSNTTLYLMRHGETYSNKAGLLQGQTSTHLNETGREQAKAAGAFLKEKNIAIQRTYASPLARAVETACLTTGAGEDSFTKDDRLMEWGFGPYEGAAIRDISEDFWAFIRDPENIPPAAGVESMEAVISRARGFLQDLKGTVQADAPENILVVSHGLLLQAILTVLLRRGWNALEDFWFGNGSICQISAFGAPLPLSAEMILRMGSTD